MNRVRLSICIPTYNFGEFIGETLQSIISQAADDVEIVVVDGASTDNTTEVVQGFQRYFSRLTYHRLEKKGGVDKDLALTVELARGEYCWLMSSDDVLKPGAIQRVLQEIKSGYDIYLCNRMECDRNLTPMRGRLWLTKNTDDRVFHFTNKEEFIYYFDLSRSIGALFSYISTIIVRRSIWNGIANDEKFTGSNYAHVSRLFSILQKGGVLKYVRQPLVLCRGDNDSFMEKGFVHRFLIDFIGYQLLASILFQDNDVQKAFKAVMRREHTWYALTELRNKIDTPEKWHEAERLLVAYGYSRKEIFCINAIGRSNFIMNAVYFFKRLIRGFQAWQARLIQDKRIHMQ